MAESQRTSLADIAKHFDTLVDPRCHINRHHPLTSVIVISIIAFLLADRYIVACDLI